MICPNCGMDNIQGSSFCVKCGNKLNTENVNNNFQQQVQEVNNVQANNQVGDPFVQNTMQQNNYVNNVNVVTNTNKAMNFFMYILMILIKPFKTFKEEEEKLTDTKNSLILSGIVVGLMLVINLIKSMITTVFTKKMDYTTFKLKTVIDFSNLKNLDWLDLLGKHLLIYAGIILAIAVVYYLASLVFKKNGNFIKLLSISATSLIPFTLVGMFASFVLGKIWSPLYMVCVIVSLIYSVLILVSLINKQFEFENDDTKIYFHLICLGALAVAGYYLYMKYFVLGTISSKVSDVLDLLG